MYEFDGETYTKESMVNANAHDSDFLAWIETAAIGDGFCDCVRVS